MADVSIESYFLMQGKPFLVSEYNGEVDASYIDEPVMRFKPVGSERTYYHRNQQYSIVALTGNTGAIQERYAYSAYGSPTITDGAGALRNASAVDNRITYTGREWMLTWSLPLSSPALRSNSREVLLQRSYRFYSYEKLVRLSQYFDFKRPLRS